MRSYDIDFFKVLLPKDKPDFNFNAAFTSLLGKELVSVSESHPFELKYLAKVSNTFEGAILKFRMRDLPKKGIPGDAEQELGLTKEQGIIEKTHFLFHPNTRILLIQRNRLASGSRKFPELISEFLQENIHILPLKHPDALRRLMKCKSQVTKMVISLAGPTEQQAADAQNPGDGWSEGVLRIIDNDDAARVNIEIKGQARVHDGRRYLGPRLVTGVRALLDTNHVESLRAWYDNDDGQEQFVDLFSDRYVDSVKVPSNGPYADSEAIWTAMRLLWRDRRSFVTNLSDEGASS